ncbi:MAG: hypothetical protein IKH14_06655 [Prevotella sp.]|nr:hypothetical protein [Prevotella sp.]MBR3445525.1 hypothetical protein [Prevotella sp.]
MEQKVISILVLVLLHISCYAVVIESTTNLNVYYPEYSKIDLVCGQMPKTTQKDVVFCCEAAFTGELLNEFKHLNIADNHICNGEMKKGYRCKANTGGFVWSKGKWKFMRKADYPTTANGWNMGFCQLLIIKDGIARPIGTKMKNNRNIYRALCEKNGKLCIIESKKIMTYEFFVKCLNAYKVTHALYLDMGRGWNYAWYRDKNGKVKEIFPESKLAPSYKYRTNWITFYK